MIGIDTNVLLRFLAGDDARQSPTAGALVRAAGGKGAAVFVNDIVMAETVWALRASFDTAKPELLAALKALLDSTVFTFESRDVMQHAVDAYAQSSADFADCLIVARNVEAGCATTHTFDRKLGTVPGTSLLA